MKFVFKIDGLQTNKFFPAERYSASPVTQIMVLCRGAGNTQHFSLFGRLKLKMVYFRGILILRFNQFFVQSGKMSQKQLYISVGFLCILMEKFSAVSKPKCYVEDKNVSYI